MKPPATITLEEAREALERHVGTTWWRRRGLARTMAVHTHRAPGAHHVVFESFVQSRATHPATRPYRGGPLDGPEHGPAPEPWEIPAQPQVLFVDIQQAFVLPHTEVARTCHECNGRGEVRCSTCGGDGNVTCSRCHGMGSVTQTRFVTSTNAQGQSESRTETYTESCPRTETCSRCHGHGRVTCGLCEGACNLVHFVRLLVKFENKSAERVLEATDLPDALVTDAEGVIALQEEEPRIEPTPGTGTGTGAYRDAPMRLHPEVDRAANELIAHLASATPAGGRVMRQRLTVRAVPVFEAVYHWGKREQRFWVYGMDRKVHAPRFPLSRTRLALACVVGAAILAVPAVAIYRANQGRIVEPAVQPAGLAQPLPVEQVITASPPPPVVQPAVELDPVVVTAVPDAGVRGRTVQRRSGHRVR